MARYLALEGRERARDIVTQQIYATPQRGGYRRTYSLLRSIYGEARKSGFTHVVIVGAAVDYATYNELGTYDNYYPGIEQDIMDRALAEGSRLPIVTFPKEGIGLEPRPFVIPAIASLYNDLEDLLEQAYRRMKRGI